ncbi:MAG: ATP-binding protein [Planctomycetota bacterium]
MSLRTLITLPFLALFAALVLALGWILAREMLAEVESRVESEQRFMLSVAASPGWPLGEESLRRIRNRAALPSDEPQAEGASEFIVLQNGTSPLTTLARGKSDGRALGDALLDELKRRPELEPLNEAIQRQRVQLAGHDFLMLSTSRAVRGPMTAPRRFFLLHPYLEIEQAKNRTLRRIIALGAAGLASALALGLLLAHWISRPVRRLAAQVKRVSAAGLNDAPLPESDAENTALERAGGEIGELSRAFRSMMESLRQSQIELLKNERLAATGKLAACVAHEIRNPLTSLRMTVQMLQSASQPSATSKPISGPNTQEAYRVILDEIDRLSLAVEELMTFASPRPPQKIPSDLNALAADTLRFLERQLAHAKVRSTFEADPTLPSDLLVDPNKLRQVLVNLILNAMQAIVRGGEIVVRTRWDGSRAVLEVQDSGPGIAPDIRATMFELFASTKAGGGGMGLAVAKQIVEEHGGTISFESAPGRTIFRVELPFLSF